MHKTPLFKALSLYLDSGMAKFHTPGHKGFDIFNIENICQYDLTEVTGCDNLYMPQGAILELENIYSDIYNTAQTLISAGGCTLCIQTMLALAIKDGDTIICHRNIHMSAVNTLALLGADVVWICSDSSSLGCRSITPSDIKKSLTQNPHAKAVYLTSPDYSGELCDIENISKICRDFSVSLLVDNAHGAHLKFLPKSLHPMDLGADMCCDSLHKTLPVLTGGALLHIKHHSNFTRRAKQTMSIFGSSSPSYLIMLSLDLCVDYLRHQVYLDMLTLIDEVKFVSSLALSKGSIVMDYAYDPTRLTVFNASLGYCSEDFLEHLHNYKIEPEYVSNLYTVFILSASNKSFVQLCNAITNLEAKPPIVSDTSFTLPQKAMSLREAMLANSLNIPLKDCLGQVCACIKTICPPGIPIIMYGEIVNKHTILALKNSGILSLDVVDYPSLEVYD